MRVRLRFRRLPRFLVPKQSLGTHSLEVPLRGSIPSRGYPPLSRVGATKQSFVALRSQAELGNEDRRGSLRHLLRLAGPPRALQPAPRGLPQLLFLVLVLTDLQQLRLRRLRRQHRQALNRPQPRHLRETAVVGNLGEVLQVIAADQLWQHDAL